MNYEWTDKWAVLVQSDRPTERDIKLANLANDTSGWQDNMAEG